VTGAEQSEAPPPYPRPHSPRERRRLSNVGHWLEGGVLGATSGLALVDAVNPELEWPRRWWPRIAPGAGYGLAAFILAGTAHHGGPRRYLRHEHQDRQHLQMAAALAAGGILDAANVGRGSRLGLAAAVASAGAMFLSHEQHGSGEARAEARRVHRRLGLSLIATGAAKGADGLEVPGPWRVAWPILGLATAAQLLAYREPTGAFEGPNAP
jgi:hypothetical protein